QGSPSPGRSATASRTPTGCRCPCDRSCARRGGARAGVTRGTPASSVEVITSARLVAMSILLIRHGETASNASRVLQTPHIPLSPNGIAQADRLAQRLAGLGVAGIVSSDYARARMTAERIAAATGAKVELWPELRERNFGTLRGRAYADLGFDPFAPEYAP